MRNSRVDEFNMVVLGSIPDNPDEVAKLIANQCNYLAEEVEEAKESAYQRDWHNLAKEIADIEYVAAFLKTLIESVGVDQEACFQAVCDNNQEKYTSSATLAGKWLMEQDAKGVKCYLSSVEVDGQTMYTVRRVSDDKVTKYPNFPSVNLEQFIPKELLNDQ